MKKAALLFLLFALAGNFVSAQKQEQARIDSLLAQLNSAEGDKDKLSTYLNIIFTYNLFDRDSGLKYERPAIELAEKMKSPEALANVKNEVGRVYWRKGEFETALKCYQEAMEIFEQFKDESKIALTTRYIGQVHADGGHYPEALKHFTTALSMYDKLKDRKNQGYIHEFFAWVYDKQGEYEKATRSSYEVLSMLEEAGDAKGIARVSATIAEFHIYLGNYDEALTYFKKGEEVLRANGERINLGYNQSLIGKVYRLMGNYPTSLTFQQAALTIGQEVKDANIIAVAYDGIGEVYKIRKEYPEALHNYLLAAESFKKVSNHREMARVYCTLGECYRITNNYSLAKKYYNEAFLLAKVIESKSLLADYFHGAELLDSAMGNWKEAYVNHKYYSLNRDSVFNQAKIEKMVQLQLQYDFNKKEAAAKEEQAAKIQRQKNQFIFLGIITILICILAIVLFTSQRRKTRTNLMLKQKSESLEEENREKTSILNIVSHDLKAPFSKINGLTELLQRTDNKEEREEYISYIRLSIEQGNALIHSLLEAQKIYDQTNSPCLTKVDLAKLIHDFEVMTNGQLEKKQQRLDVQVQTRGTHFITDKHMLTRILDNLVSNASKFSEMNKSIFFKVWMDSAALTFSIRDEGPGISSVDQKNMFKKFQKLSAIPTAGESSTGLGLSITKALVEKLNGSIQINSQPGEGTEIIISIPAILVPDFSPVA